MKYIISYDLGTGGTKTSLFNEDGKSIFSTFKPCKTYYPKDNFHEQNPNEWWNTVIETTKILVNEAGIDVNDICGIGVSGHSLGVVPVDSECNLLIDSVPIWSDSRAEKEIEPFFSKVNSDEWYCKTGNGFPPQLYSIFKILWYKANKPSLYENTYKFIGTKDYINMKLTKEICTDISYASGSGVFDLTKNRYCGELIGYSGIDKEKLPEVYQSTKVIGRLSKESSDLLGLPSSIKVVCGGVDNSCMALGAGCYKEGRSYTSLGSSAWIAVTTSTPIIDAEYKPYVFAHCVPGLYTSATAIFSAGSSYKWMRDNLLDDLKDVESKTGVDAYDIMNDMARTSVVGANKLLFNPSLAGGSSLDKSSNIRGGYFGLQLGHTKADIIRATLEGVCLNLRIALDVIKNYAELSEEMLIVGGGGKSELWRSLFADIYNMKIIETNVGQDAGALGAAAVAAVGCGLWSDFSKLDDIHEKISMISPSEENRLKYDRILEVFKQIADINSNIGDLITNNL